MTTAELQTDQTEKTQTEAILELTKALKAVVSQLSNVSADESISVFFDGTEIYRYQLSDSRVFWWGNSTTA